MTTAWLASHLDHPRLRLADCRWYLGEPEAGEAAYAAGHLPGAAYISLESELSAPRGPGRHPLPNPGAFAAHLGARGVGDRHTVVAYDDRGGAIAARLWWMLRWIGHQHVAVLDGGLHAWKGALTTDVPSWPPATLTVRAGDRPTLDRNELRAAIGTRSIIDARSPERYRGEEELIDPVAGHIPSAVNRPYTDNLDSDDRFLPAAALAARYADVEAPVVYCGSGVTACHDLLAMEVAGLAPATLYPGSWSDWSTAGFPVATD